MDDGPTQLSPSSAANHFTFTTYQLRRLSTGRFPSPSLSPVGVPFFTSGISRIVVSMTVQHRIAPNSEICKAPGRPFLQPTENDSFSIDFNTVEAWPESVSSRSAYSRSWCWMHGAVFTSQARRRFLTTASRWLSIRRYCGKSDLSAAEAIRHLLQVKFFQPNGVPP